VDEPLAICDLKHFVANYAFKNERKYVQDIVLPKTASAWRLLVRVLPA
jgi:NADH-quinone oxidoreductase subunit F